jgi:deoxyribonuclease V
MKIQKLHEWNVKPKEAIQIQLELRKRVKTYGSLRNIRLIAGADASFTKGVDTIYAAICVLSFPDLKVVEEKTATCRLNFPYVPGLLTFREGPVLLKSFKKIRNTPDVIIFDGQGLLHPRGMGIATHLGILLGIPSIGCAKSPLYGEYHLPDVLKGAYTFIKNREGEIIGACLRTRTNVKPLFVSVGNRIDLSRAIGLILQTVTRYRLPEPIRCAHSLSQLR